jgi:hypothetical protein
LDTTRTIGGLQLRSGNTLDLNGFNLTVGALSGSGGLTTGVAGTVTLTTGGDNSSTSFSGVIQDGSGTIGRPFGVGFECWLIPYKKGTPS